MASASVMASASIVASASQDGAGAAAGAAAAAAAAETHRRNRHRSEISPPFFCYVGISNRDVSIDGNACNEEGSEM